jgi:hypothetical protein
MARDDDLRDDLPGDLEALVQECLAPGESAQIVLRGAFKQILVCTDTRVMILKTGLMTGHAFGSNSFQLPYGAVSGVQVKFGILDGYLEVSAGGVQAQDKSLWAKDPSLDPNESPNCVGFIGHDAAERFRRAGALILQHAQGRGAAPSNAA